MGSFSKLMMLSGRAVGVCMLGLATAVGGIGLTGCSGTGGSLSRRSVDGWAVGVGEVAGGVFRAEAGFSPEELSRIEDNCPFGLPVKEASWLAEFPTHYVCRGGYVLEHNSIDKIPLWVCERVTAGEITGNAKRRNVFKADPLLPAGERAELEDYKGSGYDRGHMAPAGNQAASQGLKDETFYLSNMSPQVGQGFNQNIWATLEDLSREWVSASGGSEWIITGGFFHDEAEENAATADGMIEYYVIGPGAVAVPTHFYKIVVSEAPGGTGVFRAVAFVMENRKHSSAEEGDLAQFIRPIDWVEQRTGLNFMPELDPLQEQQLEGTAGTMW